MLWGRGQALERLGCADELPSAEAAYSGTNEWR